ncbi:DMT family transporter [Paenibacillus sp.]|uniref:DMT family transporter n=1 Tax=Paenibacillus sp. TaxID=58172 RepID=UPI002810B861|nr:DMT family transporter [Paenibacillus sp.]
MGWLFGVLAGGFIALQGVANARIGAAIGTWQAATLTQFTGFVAAALLLTVARDRRINALARVKPYYLAGGAFAAIIIFGNVTAIHRIGMTLAVSLVLIAQLALTFLAESNGWFGAKKRRMRWPQAVGIALMAVGAAIVKG